MGIIIRQSAKSTFFSYLGVVIGAINVLYLYPKFLATEEIGLLKFLVDVASLLAPFFLFGAGNITLKFYPRYRENKNESREFLFFILLVSIIGSCIALGLFFLFNKTFILHFQERAALLVEFYKLLPIIFFCILLVLPLEAYSRSLLKTVIPTFIKEVWIRILITVLIVAYALLSFSQQLFFELFVLIYAIALAVLIIYLIYLGRFRIRFSLSFLKGGAFKEISSFGLFAILAGTSSAIVARIDTVMVTWFENLGNTGIYAIAFFIGTVIEIPKRGIIRIAQPVVSKAWHENNLNEITSLYKKSSLNLLIIGGLLFIGIWVNIDSVFDIMPKGNLFRVGKLVVLFIGLARIFDMVTSINNEIILFSRYYKYNMVFMLSLVVLAVVSNLLLIPVYGITGAAMATAISYFLFNLFKSIFVWYKFKMQPFTLNTFVVILIGVIVYVIAWAIPSTSYPLLDIIIRSAFVTVFYVGTIVYLKLSPELNSLLNKILRLKF